MFKAEVEGILKDLQTEVNPYGEIWEEPSKSQEAEGIKPKRVFP
ncbi:uncharacterized protein METZ01_LOCUS102891 [marine metagenome]|uniref:Uncharacterized protein n=1 Tax=marine metagenome TaxID=408172 RepID=A0A381WDK2_9ZZZZ